MKAYNIKKTYDAEAKKWNSIIIKDEELYETNKTFFSLLKRYGKKTILDSGCGSGLHSVFFAKMGYDVTALDFSTKMIEEAKKNTRSLKNVNCICCDINRHRFKERFGAVWASSSLHNMKLNDLKKTLKTLVGLLEPQGILAIIMRHGSFEGIKVRNNIERYYRYSSPTEIKMLLRRYDLKWLRTTYTVFLKEPYFAIYFVKSKDD
jgi:2-polyprenyl-3-methyl-5-hydroxy-6-metoxy-1,4-benzoquinol methylase